MDRIDQSPPRRYDAERDKSRARDALRPVSGVRSAHPLGDYVSIWTVPALKTAIAGASLIRAKPGRADLKTTCASADTGSVDAAERKEILEQVPRPQPPLRGGCRAAQLEPPWRGHPVHAARVARGRSGSDGSRDRGASARRGRPRQSRDRRTALPLGGDRQVARPPSAREASSAKQSPRRSGWLPAWAHCLALSVNIPSPSEPVPLGVTPERGMPTPGGEPRMRRIYQTFEPLCHRQ